MPRVDNKPLIQRGGPRPPIIPRAVKVAAVVVGVFVLIAGLGLLVASQGGFGLGAQIFVRSLLGNTVFQVAASSTVSAALLGFGVYSIYKYRQVRPPIEEASKRSSAIDSSSESGSAPRHERKQAKEEFIAHLQSDRAQFGEYGYWESENVDGKYDFCQKLHTGITKVKTLRPETVQALDSLRDVLPKLPIEQQKQVFVILHREKGEQFIKSGDMPPGSIVLCPQPFEDGTVNVFRFLKGLDGEIVEYPNLDIAEFLKDPKQCLLALQRDYLEKKGVWIESRQKVEECLSDGRMEINQFYVWASESVPGAFGFYQKTGTSSKIEDKDLLSIELDQPLITTIASYDINNPFGMKPSPYQKQLVLNLGSGRSARGIETKAGKQKLDSHTIELRGKLPSETFFQDSHIIPKNNAVRFYIIGDCRAGQEYITTSRGFTMWKADCFVNFISECCKNLETTKEKPIVVSLMACEAALSRDSEPSFGERLSKALAAKGVHAIVKARTDVVARTSESRIENFRKLVRVGTAFRIHAEGAKQEFRTSPGDTETTITPATYRKRGNPYVLTGEKTG